MIPLQIRIKSYNKSTNTCQAYLQNGNIIDIDPFVACAVEMTDDEYNADKGYDMVDKSFVLIDYSVSPFWVIPTAGGMIDISGK